MKYGKINHVGIVVKDWNEATDRYGKLFGIKHWYEIVTDEGTFDLKYHGEKKDCKVRIFYGGKGTTKLEIIETQGEKNIYDYFYEKRCRALGISPAVMGYGKKTTNRNPGGQMRKKKSE